MLLLFVVGYCYVIVIIVIVILVICLLLLLVFIGIMIMVVIIVITVYCFVCLLDYVYCLSVLLLLLVLLLFLVIIIVIVISIIVIAISFIVIIITFIIIIIIMICKPVLTQHRCCLFLVDTLSFRGHGPCLDLVFARVLAQQEDVFRKRAMSGSTSASIKGVYFIFWHQRREALWAPTHGCVHRSCGVSQLLFLKGGPSLTCAWNSAESFEILV